MIAQLDASYIKIRPWKLWNRMISYALFEGRPVTTRGRWINPLVFAHFAVGKRLPIQKRIEKPVFILGTGRSGTTILGVVLSMHRDVGFLNEPKALWHAIHPGEDLVGSYNRNHAQYRLNASDASDSVIQNAHRIYGMYLSVSFSGRIVDKYPELIFRVPFVKAIFPDAKFIFLARNGWDTCQSIADWSKHKGKDTGKETHDWWGVNQRKWRLLTNEIVKEHSDLSPYVSEMATWAHQVNMAAVEWIVTMREGLSLLQRFPDDTHLVRYETLCSEPRKTMTQILEFLELDQNDKQFFQYVNTTLHPAAAKDTYTLNQVIRKPFHETMCALGYV
ncbi:sulfotransferase family protein [Nitrosomonas marina]|uniref:Sulfotransferase family protein n=1 Tax=Nitrosomonas marina TaxID=917 RepID=A0A1H8HNJ8_9PROT|nr:sulfotransferase [Nitrosomonas marina]SEN57663.1 Sulfotransferase family protein [Nitrosomonas marina]